MTAQSNDSVPELASMAESGGVGDAVRVRSMGDRLVVPLMACAAAVFAWWLTSRGMVVSTDSATYLSAAQHLAHGLGPTASLVDESSRLSVAQQLHLMGRIPMVEWPPGYPLLLAAFSPLGGSALQWARPVAILSAALTCGAAAWLARRLCASVAVVIVLASLSVLAPAYEVRSVIPQGYGSLATALSDTPFLPLTMLAVIAGIMSWTSSKRRWYVAGIVLVACATLVRFSGPGIGVALAAGGLLAPAAHLSRGRRNRIVRAVGYLAVGPAIMVGWSLVNSRRFGGGAARSLRWHPDSGLVGQLVRTSSAWFAVPSNTPMVLCVIVVTVCIIGPTAVALHPGLRRRVFQGTASDAPERELILVIVASVVVVMVGVLVVTRLFFDAAVIVAQRQMGVIQPVTYLLLGSVVFALIDRSVPRLSSTRRAGVATCVVVILAAVPTVAAATTVRSTRAAVAAIHQRQQYARATGALGNLPPEVLLFSNQPSGIWLSSDRDVLLLPPSEFTTTGAPNADYSTNLRRIGQVARSLPVIVAVAASIDADDHESSVSYLHRYEGFVAVAHCETGFTLWTLPESRASAAARLACP